MAEKPSGTPAVIFDDGRGRLGPLTDLRAAFDVRTAAMRTIERLKMHLRLQVIGVWVPEPLAALTAENRREPVNTPTDRKGPIAVVSGRMAVPLEAVRELAPGQAIVDPDGSLVAALTDAGGLSNLTAKDWDPDAAGLDITRLEKPALITRPWHAVSVRNRALEYDMRILTRRATGFVPRHISIIGDKADLIVDPEATIRPGVVFDVSGGPVVVSKGAELRPNCVIAGPTAIGPYSLVKEQALIRPTTCIGPVCKAAGEMGALVMQGHTNKGHEGYLGDAWLGEWVNLGAGTVSSNLMNTYGEVSSVAEPGMSREKTGETFLGPVIGDHVKTAIGTRIMTGSVVGTGSMLAGSTSVSGCVPAFRWVTDAGVKPYKIDRFEMMMFASMARRNVEPSDAYVARIRERLAAHTAGPDSGSEA